MHDDDAPTSGLTDQLDSYGVLRVDGGELAFAFNANAANLELCCCCSVLGVVSAPAPILICKGHCIPQIRTELY